MLVIQTLCVHISFISVQTMPQWDNIDEDSFPMKKMHPQIWMLTHVVCPCLLAMLETRDRILYECNRFNGVIGFLEDNHDTFCPRTVFCRKYIFLHMSSFSFSSSLKKEEWMARQSNWVSREGWIVIWPNNHIPGNFHLDQEMWY